MKKAEIILHADYMPYAAQLTPEQAGVLFMALLKKQDGNLPQEEVETMDPIVRVVLMVIMDRADREREAYERMAEAGSKGGQAKAAKNAEKAAGISTAASNSSDDIANSSNDVASSSHDVANDRVSDKPNIKPIIKNKEKQSKEKVAPTGAARFVRPTVEEVEAYCRGRGNSISAQGFINYYESQGWKVGKTPMKDWKAAIRTWELRDKKTVEQPKKPANRFHNFEQRGTDYDALLKAEGVQ